MPPHAGRQRRAVDTISVARSNSLTELRNVEPRETTIGSTAFHDEAGGAVWAHVHNHPAPWFESRLQRTLMIDQVRLGDFIAHGVASSNLTIHHMRAARS